MIKAFLETNDIECFVFGNVLANTYNVFNLTSGGVQLKVGKQHLEKATELLNQFYKKDDDN